MTARDITGRALVTATQSTGLGRAAAGHAIASAAETVAAARRKHTVVHSR